MNNRIVINRTGMDFTKARLVMREDGVYVERGQGKKISERKVDLPKSAVAVLAGIGNALAKADDLIETGRGADIRRELCHALGVRQAFGLRDLGIPVSREPAEIPDSAPIDDLFGARATAERTPAEITQLQRLHDERRKVAARRKGRAAKAKKALAIMEAWEQSDKSAIGLAEVTGMSHAWAVKRIREYGLKTVRRPRNPNVTVTRKALSKAIEAHGGSIKNAAKSLGIMPHLAYYHVKKMGLRGNSLPH